MTCRPTDCIDIDVAETELAAEAATKNDAVAVRGVGSAVEIVLGRD